jgi:hypothetical protein
VSWNFSSAPISLDPGRATIFPGGEERPIALSQRHRSSGGIEDSVVDICFDLSDPQASAFRAALYSFISGIENRDAPEDSSVSVTIIPVDDRTQYVVRFANGTDARNFTDHLPPAFLRAADPAASGSALSS